MMLSALETKIITLANSVDPDETAHNNPSHQDLHCLPLLLLFFANIPVYNSVPKCNKKCQ